MVSAIIQWQVRLPRCISLFILTLILAIIPSVANANIVFPSVVHWITSAGPYSLLILPLVITFPLLLAISFIEALIARKFITTERSLGRIVFILLGINALTSAIGLVTMPDVKDIPLGLLLAFLITSIVEALCLPVLKKKGQRRIDFSMFKASFVMNAASYAFLGLIVFTLISLPGKLMPENIRSEELKGDFVVCNNEDKVVLAIDASTGKHISGSGKYIDNTQNTYKTAWYNGKRYGVRVKDNALVGVIPGGPYNNNWEISNNGFYYANYLLQSDTVVFWNLKTNQHKSFKHIDTMSLCRKTGMLALRSDRILRIYNPVSNRAKRIVLHGPYEFGQLTWSPDGNFIAYPAIVSPFTQYIGETSPDSVRVVSVDGRERTLLRDVNNEIDFENMYWFAKNER